jgi:two-component system sensor histidine kinase/response regulator
MQARRATILVVEDDELVCDLLRELLTREGYTVECAPDGAAGLARVAAGGIDLVLLDVMLPGVNGIELCRQLRASEPAVYLPIIMLTAVRGEAERHAGFEAGADDYVTKPFDTTDLLDRVRVWVRTRERLEANHERLLAQQARLRELEQQALRERLAQDQAVLAMARTASHELRQPLTYLLGALELWEAGRCSPATHPTLQRELQEAAKDLAARVELLSRVVRYEPAEVSGYCMIDLERAQEPAAEPPGEPPGEPGAAGVGGPGT